MKAVAPGGQTPFFQNGTRVLILDRFRNRHEAWCDLRHGKATVCFLRIHYHSPLPASYPRRLTLAAGRPRKPFQYCPPSGSKRQGRSIRNGGDGQGAASENTSDDSHGSEDG